MELASQALAIGAVGLGLLVILAHMRHKHVTAFVLSELGLLCVLATIVVDFVRNDYPHAVLQGIMLVFFTIYLVWQREHDPLSA
jgi:uncharacterized membrane protein YfcA